MNASVAFIKFTLLVVVARCDNCVAFGVITVAFGVTTGTRCAPDPRALFDGVSRFDGVVKNCFSPPWYSGEPFPPLSWSMILTTLR